MDIANVTQTAAAERSLTSNSQLSSDAFLTLLVAQLRAQNPLEPLNPNEFVAQLVQFNTLEQIIGIRQALETSDGTAPVASPIES